MQTARSDVVLSNILLMIGQHDSERKFWTADDALQHAQSKGTHITLPVVLTCHSGPEASRLLNGFLVHLLVR